MAETIREFLVSLGYSVDKTGEKDFTKSVKAATDDVAKLGAVIAATGAAITAAVIKISSDFDRLYFASQRTNASAANLKNFANALTQLGGSAEEAQGAIDGLATSLRTTPGREGWLQALGVQTRDAAGHMRDNVKIFRDFLGVLERKPEYVAIQYAEQIGLSAQSYVKLRGHLGDLDKAIEKSGDINKAFGVDQDEAAKASKNLMNSLRDLRMQVEAIFDKAIIENQDLFIQAFKSLGQWLRDNSGNITWAIRSVAEAGIAMAKALGKDVGGALYALECLAEFFIGAKLINMLAALGKLRVGILALASALLYFDEKFGTLTPGGAMAKSAGAGQPLKPGEGATGQPASADDPLNTYLDHPIANAWRWITDKLGFRKKQENPLGSTTIRSNRGPDAYTTGGGFGGEIDRTSFSEELRDPAVKQRLFAITEAEVGGQGPEAQQAFMETIFNRASSRRQTLAETMRGSYFPQETHDRTAARMGDPRLEKKYASIFDRVSSGSNISGFATGNASKDPRTGREVGFDGGPQTSKFGGERFGIEGSDRKWARQAQSAAKTALLVRARSLIDWAANSPRIASPFDTMPIGAGTNITNGPAVTLNQNTNVTVNGATDPNSTGSEIQRRQNSVNNTLLRNATGAVR